MIHSIYRATNTINGKCYVGYTKLRLNTRKKQHEIRASKGNENRYFYNAIRKHGKQVWIWEILYQSLDVEHILNEMEPYFIRENQSHCSQNGYNLSFGGEETTNGMRKYTDGQQTRYYHVGLQPDGWTLHEYDRKEYSKRRREEYGEEINAKERERYHLNVEERRDKRSKSDKERRATENTEEREIRLQKKKDEYYADVEKSRKYQVEYRNKHKDEINRRARERRAANPELAREKRRAKYQKQKEKTK